MPNSCLTCSSLSLAAQPVSANTSVRCSTVNEGFAKVSWQAEASEACSDEQTNQFDSDARRLARLQAALDQLQSVSHIQLVRRR